MVQPLLPIIYQLDKTGTNTNNRVLNEIHTLTTARKRAIAPIHSPFYADNFIIRDNANNRVLDSSEYSFFLLQSIPSSLIGKEIYSLVIIENSAVSNDVSIDYNTLGGEYSRSYAPTIDLINVLLNDDRPLSWPNIVNTPAYFNPVFHFHSIDDQVGYEYVLAQLGRLRDTILIKNSENVEGILKYLDQLVANANSKITENSTNLTTVSNNLASLNTLVTQLNTQVNNVITNIANSDIAAQQKITAYKNS